MFSKFHAFFLFAFFAVTPVFAQQSNQPNPVYTFRAKIDQVDKLIEDPTGVLTTEYVSRMTMETKARFGWRYDGKKQFFVEPFVRKSDFRRVEDELTFGVFAEYRHPISNNEKVRLRWRGGLELKQDVYNRITVQVAVNARRHRSRSSRVTLRYRYRDQNDRKTFNGYDQHEMFVSLQQVWKPTKGDVKRVTGMVYGDVRQADAERFNYVEIGARLNMRFEPHQDWKLSAFAKGFVREYGGSFSPDYDFARQDRRFTVGLEATYDLGQKQFLTGALGWEVNKSNIKIRSYSGALFRLEYVKKLN